MFARATILRHINSGSHFIWLPFLFMENIFEYPNKVENNWKFNYLDKNWNYISKKWFDEAEEFKNWYAIVRIENYFYKKYKIIYDSINKIIWNIDDNWLFSSFILYILVIIVALLLVSPIVIILLFLWFDIEREEVYFSLWYTLYFIFIIKLGSYFKESKYIISTKWEIINKKWYSYISDFNEKWFARVSKKFKIFIDKVEKNTIDTKGNFLEIWHE